jgi:hypothetical protein
MQGAVLTPRPNIYLIMADGRGRQDVLRGYGYDSAPFVNGLEDLDFDVAARSQTNYAVTQLALTSLFTGSHLEDLGQDMKRPVDWALVRGALSLNPSWGFLERAGYETVVVASGWEHLPLRRASRYIDTGQPSEFEILGLHRTVVPQLFPSVGAELWRDSTFDRTKASLELLPKLAQEALPRPTAVFLDLPVPHPPFVFDEHCDRWAVSTAMFGSLERDRRSGTSQTAAMNMAQTRCVDSLVTDAVLAVVAIDPTAVIVVFSDHGPEERLDWWAPEPGPVADRMANFFAARTPGEAQVFPDDVSLVNVMPLLLNAYFGTSIPLADDRQFFGPGPGSDLLLPMGS